MYSQTGYSIQYTAVLYLCYRPTNFCKVAANDCVDDGIFDYSIMTSYQERSQTQQVTELDQMHNDVKCV